MRVISFSLWGVDNKYLVGAVENAVLARAIYPGWRAFFYVDRGVDSSVVTRLKAEGAVVIVKDIVSCGPWPYFWRFLPIDDPAVSTMIVRDTDSRLSLRERSAVEDWLASDKTFHIMRDHPFHRAKILAGMWGCRKPIPYNMEELISDFLVRTRESGESNEGVGLDQNFLAHTIWPFAMENAVIHDDFFTNAPFPCKRRGYEFVGQIYNADNLPCKRYERILASHLRRATVKRMIGPTGVRIITVVLKVLKACSEKK